MNHPDLPRTQGLHDRSLRISAWRGRSDVMVIGPVRPAAGSPTAVRHALQYLADHSVREAYTTALAPAEQHAFTDAGFTHHEHLHLLSHDLTDIPTAPTTGSAVRLRRGWWRDYDAVLDVDTRAFDGFWRFDRTALIESRRATPVSRLRVATGPGPHPVAGYAVTGRAQRTAYLQRLAVHPGAQGAGTGTALVVDSLRWADQRGAGCVLVNTQEHNDAALRLYLRLGFSLQPDGLDVLHWTLT